MDTFLIRIYWCAILYNVVIRIQVSIVHVFDPEEWRPYDVYWCDASSVRRCFILKACNILLYTLVYYIFYIFLSLCISDWCVNIKYSSVLTSSKTGALWLKRATSFKFTTTDSIIVCVCTGVYECALMCSGVCCWVMCIW